MKVSGYVTLVYGLLILVGGVMGGVTAGSAPSLIAGVLSGILAGVAGALILKGQAAGLILALVLALALAGFGGKSWLVDHKAFMPRGLIFCLSLAELLALAPALLRRG